MECLTSLIFIFLKVCPPLKTTNILKIPITLNKVRIPFNVSLTVVKKIKKNEIVLWNLEMRCILSKNSIKK